METIHVEETAVRKGIDKGNQSFMTVVEKGDVEAFDNVYTEDAVLMPSHTPAIRGREGIKSFFSGALRNGINKVELVTEEVEGAEEFAAETGHYKMFASGTLADEGKYMVLWKRVGSDWRIARDIFNSDLPS